MSAVSMVSPRERSDDDDFLLSLAEQNCIISGAPGKIWFARSVGRALELYRRGLVLEIDGRTEALRARHEEMMFVALARRLERFLEDANRQFEASGRRALVLITEGHEVPLAECLFRQFRKTARDNQGAKDDVVATAKLVESVLQGEYAGASVLTVTSFPEALPYAFPGPAVFSHAHLWLEASDQGGELVLQARRLPRDLPTN